jgi:hypothetical protein
MDGYINNVQTWFNHPDPKISEQSPHKHRPIQYGAKEQYANNEVDTSPKLDAKGIKWVQAINGALLYYARAVDNRLLLTLNAIGVQQAAPTENTLTEVNKLLNYVATYPSNGTTYRASKMTLAVHSDASFLSESKSRSRVGLHTFVSNNDPIPKTNGPVLSIAQVFKSVMALAAEAELAALFTTAQEMVPLHNTLKEIGWAQSKSPIQVDNSTATGYVNNMIVVCCLKSLDMKLNWLKCCEAEDQFRIFWDKVSHNLANYHTKHHPPEYHLAHNHTHAGW